MIRHKPSLSKPTKEKSKRKGPKGDEQNIKPGFNTRGYFDPSLPYDEEYLKVKQKVFQKYRSKQQEIVMIDNKNSIKSALIQRGLLNPIPTTEQEKVHDPLGNKLLKIYLQRKQKKQMIEHEKFKEIPKMNQALTVRNSSISTRTAHSRQLSSRISTNSIPRIDDLCFY